MITCAERPMEIITIECAEPTVIRQATHLEILECVCLCCGVDINIVINSYRGKQIVVDARHIAMYIIKKKCPVFTYRTLGLLFGGRDHSTSIAAIRKIDGLLDVDKKFKVLYECCLEKINERLKYGAN